VYFPIRVILQTIDYWLATNKLVPSQLHSRNFYARQCLIQTNYGQQ